MAETPKAKEGGGDPSEILVGVDEQGAGVQATVEQHLSSVEEAVSTSADVVHTNDVLGYATVKLANASTADQQAAIEHFSAKSNVRYAEENGTYRALYSPNDPQFSSQYAPQMVNAPDAWDTTLGDSSVKVAVVDTGVKYDHPDLVDNMDTSVTNHGYDFVNDDGDPYPEDMSSEYHGTHVAGIAAAATDNGTGVAGISNCSILSVRVLDVDGFGSWSDIADGVQYAADQGADVINMSLGGTSDSSTLENACAYAHSMGVLLVVAAGNDYRNNASYPARYDECLAVSSLTSSGTLSSFSNAGKEIELSAPGSSVLSTWTDDGYDTISGTSMATPVVAGVAALAQSQHGIGGEELRQHLKETAADIGLPAGEQGAGRVDANNAVSTTPGGSTHDHVGAAWSGDPGTHGLRVNVGSSTSPALSGRSDEDGATAVRGRARGSGYTDGVKGIANSTDGRGVFGEATNANGSTRGVYGVTWSTNGIGVQGHARASSGYTDGVVGRTDSPDGRGVYGYSTADTGVNRGVIGETASANGYGVQGWATNSSGYNNGIYGRTDSVDGTGVYGLAQANSGTNYGIRGETKSGDGYGVYSDGDLHVQGDFTASGTKNFVQTVSTDAGPREVAYTAVEADRAQTETTGVAELSDGRAVVELPDHFGLVTSETEDLVVQLTPYGGSEGLKVVDRSTDHVVVESLGDDEDYEFAYTVRGTRAGYEDKEVVLEANDR